MAGDSTAAATAADARDDVMELMDKMEIDGPQEGEDAKPLERVALDYTPTYQRFVVRNKTFTQQYSHIYCERLQQMRPMVLKAARERWGEPGTEGAPSHTERVINVAEGERTILVGTLFKDMPVRPSILDEYKDQMALEGPLAPVSNYTSEKDFLQLEDESGRVLLSPDGGKLRVGEVCTGMMVAVLGCSDGSHLVVEDWCTAGMPSQPKAALEPARAPEYVLLVSGLRLSEGSDLLPLQMLIDYIGGHLGGEADRREVVSRVGRVIVAGDLLTQPEPPAVKERHLSREQQQALAQPLRNLDLMLSQLAAAVPLDIMPGESDPSNHTLPQQPLHSCLFPRTSRYLSLKLVTNPYEATIGGRVFLGCSGQALDDMRKYTAEKEGEEEEGRGLDLLEQTLSWRHLAPTAPDTLDCHPFCDIDPFILRKCPHVYFCGNQEAFGTRLVKGPEGQVTRVVCVPAFSRTQEAVLVELHSLEAKVIKFAGYMAPEGSN